MTSPLGILAAGAGAALGILAIGPLAAVPGAALAWAARVAAAVPRDTSRADVAPRRLGQPWRTYVERAQASEARFAAAVRRTRPGPLRDRLNDIGERLQAAVVESWEIAQRGQALSDARREIDVAGVTNELASARQWREATVERGGADPSASGAAGRGTYAATISALEAQLGAARRMDDFIARADAQLRLLDARMAEAVTRAIDLSAPTGDDGDLEPLGEDVDSVVTEMELLRQALDEAHRTADA
jgi:hypothetical protein